MDYSQFLVMHQEIGLLVLILLVFLFDTFSSRPAPKGFTMFTVCLFGLLTALASYSPSTSRWLRPLVACMLLHQ